ncbi:hypothetical protein [Paremcibacter congregatus]|uniref:hypothetical protein n=1 Tax=Paremcibacter congregatus TaxID=2043170 RepID=UPI0030EDBD92
MVFLGDIAFILDVLLLAAGLIVYHWATQEKSQLLKWVAWGMIIIGILAVICTTYYWMSYYQAGVFEVHNMMPHNKL